MRGPAGQYLMAERKKELQRQAAAASVALEEVGFVPGGDIEPTSPRPHVTLVLTSPGPHVTLVLTSPGPHATLVLLTSRTAPPVTAG